MTKAKPEEYIFHKGGKFQVEFYFTASGEIPAKRYLDRASENVKVKLAVFVKYIAEAGTILDIGKFRLVDPKEKIYEFKPLRHRFFNFFYKGGKIIITNAYMKKSQKLDKKELRKAKSMKEDYIRRAKGGIYYEKKES